MFGSQFAQQIHQVQVLNQTQNEFQVIIPDWKSNDREKQIELIDLHWRFPHSPDNVNQFRQNDPIMFYGNPTTKESPVYLSQMGKYTADLKGDVDTSSWNFNTGFYPQELVVLNQFSRLQKQDGTIVNVLGTAKWQYDNDGNPCFHFDDEEIQPTTFIPANNKSIDIQLMLRGIVYSPVNGWKQSLVEIPFFNPGNIWIVPSFQIPQFILQPQNAVSQPLNFKIKVTSF